MTKITSDIQRLEAIRIASGIYLDPDNSRGVNDKSVSTFIDVANRIYQFINNGQTGDPDVKEDQGESVLGYGPND